MIRDEIIELMEQMTEEELIAFRDEILARWRSREVGQVLLAEECQEE